MKNYGQNYDEPAVLVTASKGQAAAAINGTTSYKSLNSLTLDEVSVLGNKTLKI